MTVVTRRSADGVVATILMRHERTRVHKSVRVVRSQLRIMAGHVDRNTSHSGGTVRKGRDVLLSAATITVVSTEGDSTTTTSLGGTTMRIVKESSITIHSSIIGMLIMLHILASTRNVNSLISGTIRVLCRTTCILVSICFAKKYTRFARHFIIL
jgi:hypothetical protein